MTTFYLQTPLTLSCLPVSVLLCSVLHVSNLCLSLYRLRESGAQNLLHPCPGSDGTGWPRFAGCPARGPVPATSEAWLSCGRQSARRGWGRLRGAGPSSLQGPACAEVVLCAWLGSREVGPVPVCRGCMGLQQLRSEHCRAESSGSALAVRTRPRRRWTTASTTSLPCSLLRPFCGPHAPPASPSCASVGGGSCPVLCLGHCSWRVLNLSPALGAGSPRWSPEF